MWYKLMFAVSHKSDRSLPNLLNSVFQGFITMLLKDFNKHRTYIQHASLVSTTLATKHAWHCGMSNTYTSG